MLLEAINLLVQDKELLLDDAVEEVLNDAEGGIKSAVNLFLAEMMKHDILASLLSTKYKKNCVCAPTHFLSSNQPLRPASPATCHEC